MTKETYREIEGLAVRALKAGLADPVGYAVCLTAGLQALRLLHEIRYGATAGHPYAGLD